MKILVVIPARGGSKGLPGKNIRPLCGKPLIYYSIDSARSVVDDCDICVSTDDLQIKSVVENYGLEVPFIRPSELASDTASTNDVLLHAVEFYANQGKTYDAILLLQPTSPLRTNRQVQEVLSCFDPSVDMVLGVKRSHAAAVMCHENDEGLLENTLSGAANRRQDVEVFYEVNGALYLINVQSLNQKGLSQFDRRIKYVMEAQNSIDIDDLFDFELAEFMLTKGLVNLK